MVNDDAACEDKIDQGDIKDQAEVKAITVTRPKKEKPRFTNICTFTKPVYRAYLQGAESGLKKAAFVVFIAISVLILAYGVMMGGRLDFIGVGLFGCVICGLGFGQPWMIARMKTANTKQKYGKFQKNITRFYEDHMAMENVTAGVEAVAPYSDIKRVKETEDFIYLYVGKYCYFAIMTGFTRGEEEIPEFKQFISERAVNAKGRLKK